MSFVKGMGHICIATKNLEKSIDFYTRVFEFELRQRVFIEDEDMEIAVVSHAGIAIQLVRFTDGREYNYGDGLIEMLGFVVDDIFAAVEKLRMEGVEFLMEEPKCIAPNVYFIYFRGPSGERLELAQRERDV